LARGVCRGSVIAAVVVARQADAMVWTGTSHAPMMSPDTRVAEKHQLGTLR
jgi:hypothetical protein